MEILVDFLTFSDTSHDYGFWIEKLGFSGVEFEQGTPRYGWTEHQFCTGVHLYLNGREGVCVELSGKGCRFLESLHGNEFSWVQLFADLLSYDGCHVSRLDIAGDDFDGILDFSRLYRFTAKRRYICRARRCVWMNGAEQEILFGASSSDTRLRIYNKALERGVEGKWVRCEFQFRNDSALSFIQNLLQKQSDIGEVYSGVLVNYLRYTVRPPDECNNNERIDTAPWWYKFTSGSERIKNFKVGGLEYNYSDLDSFIKKQCASSCKAFIQLNGGNIEPLLEIINKSECNARQRMLLNTSDFLK